MLYKFWEIYSLHFDIHVFIEFLFRERLENSNKTIWIKTYSIFKLALYWLEIYFLKRGNKNHC